MKNFELLHALDTMQRKGSSFAYVTSKVTYDKVQKGQYNTIGLIQLFCITYDNLSEQLQNELLHNFLHIINICKEVPFSHLTQGMLINKQSSI